MEPLLLGLAAPSVASTANAVGRTVSAITKPFASFLQEKLQPGVVKLPPRTGVEEIRARADILQGDLERRIAQVIESSGVQLDSPIRLSMSDFDGTLEVDTATPQRAVLEAALASDPSIASDFRELAIIRKLLTAAESRQPVAAYASQGNDRYEAVLQLSAFGDEAQLDFE